MGEMAHPAMHLEYLVAGVSTTAGAPALAKPVLSLVPPYRSPAWPIVFLALNRVCSNVSWSSPALVRSRLSGTMIVLANSRTRYAGITCPQTGFHKGPPHATPRQGQGTRAYLTPRQGSTRVHPTPHRHSRPYGYGFGILINPIWYFSIRMRRTESSIRCILMFPAFIAWCMPAIIVATSLGVDAPISRSEPASMANTAACVAV